MDVPVWLQWVEYLASITRDVIFILFLLILIFITIFTYRKVKQLMATIDRTARKVEETVTTLQKTIATPAAAGSGAAFTAGKFAAFMKGFSMGRGKKKPKEQDE